MSSFDMLLMPGGLGGVGGVVWSAWEYKDYLHREHGEQIVRAYDFANRDEVAANCLTVQ